VEEGSTVAVGSRLGKYRITEKLGEGGMGVVFGGEHEALGRRVAVKLLRAEFVKNDTVLQRFQQEAEAVSRIGHANIVAVYDFGRAEDGSVYYVMERIEGETMTRRMRAGPIEPEEAVAIFAQICRALQATHARNIIHRDLKPDNVLLQPQKSGFPHVKLVDFGVAKMREDNPTGGGGNLTQSGTLLGTPTYMAPEQILTSAKVDARADLYSLGAMLYEVLTGLPPFGRGQMMEILTRHVREAVVPPSQRPRAEGARPIPPALDAFVVRALAKKPEERQPDAAAFIAELEAAWGLARPPMMGGLPAAIQGGAPGVAPTPAPVAAARRWPLLAAIGAVVLLGGGGAALLLRTGEPAKPPPQPVQAAPVESALHVQAGKIIDQALAGDALGRRRTLEALGEVADRSSMAAVVSGLSDDNPEVRRAAAVAAAAIGRPEDAELRRALAEAAGRSGGPVAVDLAAARLQLGDATAQEDLQKALQIRDGSARLRAAVALADAGKVSAPVLRAAIQAAPPTVRRSLRWQAYGRLFKLGDPAFVAELKTALVGADPVARLDAAQALARQKDEAGLLALAGIAKEAADPVDRVEAAAVQAELDDVGAREALMAALGAAQPAVRARAATALGRLAPAIPDQETLAKELTALLADPDPVPRTAAAAAILALKDHPRQ
jgi:eukaryotic-like serine/threonine-protein kinase